ncbi:MAG TPA: tol-pal system protein YbgF [Polyangia bacterium]
MRLLVRAIGISSIALMVSCAHRQSNQVEVDQLHRSIEAMRAQNAAYAKQVEELENRLFILSDQLESRKVNDEKVEAPRLPTVALHPATTSLSNMVANMVPAGTEPDSEPEVEYAGEAAKSSTHRPVLRMRGDAAEVSIMREPPAAQPMVRVTREGSPRASRDDGAEAVGLYRKSFEALRAGKPEEAAQGFKEFLRAFPASDLADNSQYWLGECYYDRKDFTQAVREFRRVVERYPNGNKVPDALLKVGFSYLALGSAEAGKQTLTQLQRSYPRHEAAVLAGARLADLDRTNPVRAAGNAGGLTAGAAPAAKAAQIHEEAP